MESKSKLKNKPCLIFGTGILFTSKYEYNIEDFDMKDEFCVDVHIPRGGKLDNYLVKESLNTAQTILPQMYKELPQNINLFFVFIGIPFHKFLNASFGPDFTIILCNFLFGKLT